MPVEGIPGQGSEETVKVRPEEEVIKLGYDDNDRVAVDRRPKGKGKGKLKGAARFEAFKDDDAKADGADNREKGPKPKHMKMGAGLKKFSRPGPTGRPKGVQNMKLGGIVKKDWKTYNEAVFKLTQAEVLQTGEAGFLKATEDERTHRVTQADIEEHSGVGVARKRFSFDLPYGPYYCSYTHTGQQLVVGGRKGHIAMISCDTMKMSCEIHVKETIRAVQSLHSPLMFAVAQKKYTYIYDNQGVELHCMKDQKFITRLDFLRYHYLLVSSGDNADLYYKDISTGHEVCRHRTTMGPTRCMRQNPRTAVMHLGHSNGKITLWTPSVKEPVVNMFGHSGHVTGLAVHDNYMVSTGADNMWKVWDLRKYETLHAFRSYGPAPEDVDVSMTGVIALGFGSHCQFWKDAFNTSRPARGYMQEEFPANMITSVRFRPYEDVCSVGRTGGFGTLIVPGAGMANFDSFESNPYEMKNQRREREVRTLLEKLQPDSIMLDPNQIGNINEKVAKKYEEEELQKVKDAEEEKKKVKKKKRGKDKVGSRMKRKALKEGKGQRQKAKDRLDGEGAEDGEASDDGEEDEEDDEDQGDDDPTAVAGGDGRAPPRPPGVGAALSRFYGKRRKKT